MLEGHQSAVRRVVVSPLDDDLLITIGKTGDPSIKVWSVRGRRCLKTIETDHDMLLTMALTPECDAIAVAGGPQGFISIYDLETGELRQRLDGHDDLVWSLDFSPDGRRLISGSMDRTIKIWDLESGIDLVTFRNFDDWVFCAKLSPDGCTLISGGELDGESGPFRVFHASTADEVSEAISSPGWNPTRLKKSRSFARYQ